MNWIDITQKMPPDQERVIVLTKTDSGQTRRLLAAFHPAKSLEQGADQEGGEYDEETDEWWMPGGWYEAAQRHAPDFIQWAISDQVTHWLPLPKKPPHPGIIPSPKLCACRKDCQGDEACLLRQLERAEARAREATNEQMREATARARDLSALAKISQALGVYDPDLDAHVDEIPQRKEARILAAIAKLQKPKGSK